MRKKHKIIIFLFIILVIAGFFRLWQLDTIPPGLYPDEAMNGNDAISTLETDNYKIFYPDNNGREGLFINIQALFLKIFGVYPWSLRLVSAIFGILTVLGIYLLTKELFLESRIRNQESRKNHDSLFMIHNSETIALLSAFFLATSFWHVNFSRIGFRAIMVPFLLVFAFYFLFRGFRKEKILDFIWGGIFFGLGFHTYIAYRFSPIILLFAIVACWVIYSRERGIKLLRREKTCKLCTYVAIYLFVAFLVALPIGYYFLQNPQDFFGRAGGVSVFASENPILEFGKSVIKTLVMFNIAGDYNWRHNYSGSSQLMWPVGILFLIGIAISFKKVFIESRIKNQESRKNHDSLFMIHNSKAMPYFIAHSFLVVLFLVMLLPSILTTEGLPHALRSIGVIPPVYIFAGLGTYWLFEKLKNFSVFRRTFTPLDTRISNGAGQRNPASTPLVKNWLINFILIIFLIGLTYASFDRYFIDWASQSDVKGAFTKKFADIGIYLKSLPPEIQKYVIVNEDGALVKGIPMPAQTVIFTSYPLSQGWPKDSEIKYLLPEEIKNMESRIKNFTPNEAEGHKLLIVPLSYNKEIFSELKQKFPQGEIKNIDDFWIFEIE